MTNKRIVRAEMGQTFSGHLVDNSVWRSRLVGRTINAVLIDVEADVGAVLVLDDGTFFAFGDDKR